MSLTLDSRPSVDSILMNAAWDWSTRGTCNRLQVGAVLARNGRSIVSGYNGAPPGFKHCDHSPEEAADPAAHCTLANHAEENVVAFAAAEGLSTRGTTLYATVAPCYKCSGLIIAAGIIRVVYAGVAPSYAENTGVSKLAEAGIKLERA